MSYLARWSRIARLTALVLMVRALAGGVWAQEAARDGADEQAVRQIQEALLEHQPERALMIARQAIGNAPDDQRLRVQLARIYAYQRKDRQASGLLQRVLREHPSDHDAKMALAQVLGYRGDYRYSNRLYRELLAALADDEGAAVGLIHNLIAEDRRNEARQQLESALQRHPHSLPLLQYKDSVASGNEVPEYGLDRIEVSESFFADSAGNSSLSSFQTLRYRANRFTSAYLRVDEKSLWDQSGSRANVLSASNDFRLAINRHVSLVAGGGAVRFADSRSCGLYSGDLELRPFRGLYLSGGYSRFPISPTVRSTESDLLSQGWGARIAWAAPRSSKLLINGTFSKHRYSDGNLAEREAGEVLRWTGGSSFAVATGYSFRHLHFAQDLSDGYFGPRQYRSHLGETGIRFRIGRIFRAEYMGLAGAESVESQPYTPASQIAFRNHLLLRRWDVGVNYSRYQLAQSTGTFQANSVTVTVGHRFSAFRPQDDF